MCDFSLGVLVPREDLHFVYSHSHVCLKVCCFMHTLIFEFRTKPSGKSISFRVAGLTWFWVPMTMHLFPAVVTRAVPAISGWLISVGKPLCIYTCLFLPKPVLAGSSSVLCLGIKAGF